MKLFLRGADAAASCGERKKSSHAAEVTAAEVTPPRSRSTDHLDRIGTGEEMYSSTNNTTVAVRSTAHIGLNLT